MGTPEVLTPLLQDLNLTEVYGSPQGLQANLTRAPGGGRRMTGIVVSWYCSFLELVDVSSSLFLSQLL